MKRFAAVAALFVGISFLADEAQAQQTLPLSFEGRAGVAIPTGDLGDEFDPGFAFGANIAWHFTPMFGVYGGYSQAAFGTGDDSSVRSQGFDLGAHVDLPSPMLAPWLRGGLVFKEMHASRGAASLTSDTGTGFEVGGGIAFPIADMISLTPGLRYTSFPVTYQEFGVDQGDNASYLTLDVGVRVRL